MSTTLELCQDYVLRTERPEDDAFLLKLYASTRDGDPALVRSSEEEKQQLFAMENRLIRETAAAVYPAATALIIEVDNTPAGEIIVDRSERAIRLVDIMLLPRFQGRGIGSTAVGRLCDEADARQVPLFLTVASGNTAAQRLYRRAGFVATDSDALFIDMVRHVRAPRSSLAPVQQL